MARTSIGRRIVKTLCRTDYFDLDNNEHTDEIIEVWGDYDLEHAQAAVSKQLGVTRLLVKEVRHKSWYCTQSYAEFFANSQKSDYKEY